MFELSHSTSVSLKILCRNAKILSAEGATETSKGEACYVKHVINLKGSTNSGCFTSLKILYSFLALSKNEHLVRRNLIALARLEMLQR